MEAPKWLTRLGLLRGTILSTFAATLCLVTGCRTMCNAGADYMSADNPGVVASSWVGAAAGGVVGIPVIIIALPITIPIAERDEHCLCTILEPWAVCALTCASVTGYLPAQLTQVIGE